MITEDYISFEIAKLLKEKGFNNISPIMYKENGKICINTKSVVSWRLKYWYPCLTLQTAMKWLREIHNLCLFVIPATIDNTLRPGYTIYPKCNNKWEWCASKNDGSKATFGCDINKDYCDSYEDACEAAIKYCLENLI